MSRRITPTSFTPEPVRALAEPISTSLARYATLSYLGMRRAVGIIALMLPFTLSVGGVILQGTGIQVSISGYYYTDMRNVFVGALCAIGVFLMSCRGYDRRDEIAGYLAGFFAIGVALFPTTPSIDGTSRDYLIGSVHLSFVALFFLTLAYISLMLFPKTDPNKNPTPEKLMRNMVYRVCGWIILICMLLVVVGKLLPLKTLAGPNPTFVLESTIFLAFGMSWLIKGEAFLSDRGS